MLAVVHMRRGFTVHTVNRTCSSAVGAGREINSRVSPLASAAVDRQFKAYPQMRQFFVGERYDACLQDTGYHIEAIAQSLMAEEDRLFDEYAVWAKVLLANLGLPDSCLVGSLMMIRETLVAELPEDQAHAAAATIDSGLNALADAAIEIETAIPEAAPLSGVARSYLDAVLAGDRAHAWALVSEQAEAGVSRADIYEHVFRAVQHEVGRLWQQGRISVAMEHYATGATEVIMARFAMEGLCAGARDRRFVGACVAGEQHELGMRMACDVLESQGWQVIYLGANTPHSAVLAAIEEHEPHALGLSASTPFRVSAVRDTIAGVREAGHEHLPIVVGGRPFDQVPQLWRTVGADHGPGAVRSVSTELELLLAS